MEQLEQEKPRIIAMAFKVNEDEQDEIMRFVAERNWKLSAFIRVALKNEMSRLQKEGR